MFVKSIWLFFAVFVGIYQFWWARPYNLDIRLKTYQSDIKQKQPESIELRLFDCLWSPIPKPFFANPSFTLIFSRLSFEGIRLLSRPHANTLRGHARVLWESLIPSAFPSPSTFRLSSFFWPLYQVFFDSCKATCGSLQLARCYHLSVYTSNLLPCNDHLSHFPVRRGSVDWLRVGTILSPMEQSSTFV